MNAFSFIVDFFFALINGLDDLWQWLTSTRQIFGYDVSLFGILGGGLLLTLVVLSIVRD